MLTYVMTVLFLLFTGVDVVYHEPNRAVGSSVEPDIMYSHTCVGCMCQIGLIDCQHHHIVVSTPYGIVMQAPAT